MSQPVTQPVNQPSLIELWEEHTKYEFAVRDTDATIATMVDDAYVNHIPVMTGGYGKARCTVFTPRISSRKCLPIPS